MYVSKCVLDMHKHTHKHTDDDLIRSGYPKPIEVHSSLLVAIVARPNTLSQGEAMRQQERGSRSRKHLTSLARTALRALILSHVTPRHANS